MLPVAAVAQTLGYEVTYTSRPEGALVTVESDSFQVRLELGPGLIYRGDQAGRGGGDDRPAGLRRGPLHRGPRHHLGPRPAVRAAGPDGDPGGDPADHPVTPAAECECL